MLSIILGLGVCFLFILREFYISKKKVFNKNNTKLGHTSLKINKIFFSPSELNENPDLMCKVQAHLTWTEALHQ